MIELIDMIITFEDQQTLQDQNEDLKTQIEQICPIPYNDNCLLNIVEDLLSLEINKESSVEA